MRPTGLLPMKFDFVGSPMGKPRMTQRDKWKKRDVVERYYALKDQLNSQANKQHYTPGNSLRIFFYIQMPESWSKKKRDSLNGKPHQQKPDIDNLVKAFLDCLVKEDKGVYHIEATKYWVSDNPGIVAINIDD